jgi:hypothetical protein
MEAVVAHLKVLFRYSLGETQENNKNSVMLAGCLVEIRTDYLQRIIDATAFYSDRTSGDYLHELRISPNRLRPTILQAAYEV